MSVALIQQSMSAARRPRVCHTVAPDLVQHLRARGFDTPVRTLADPRLDYPELLLLDGFTWEPGEAGSRYVQRCEDENYWQCVEYYPDDTIKVTTRAGRRGQELVRRPDGGHSERRLI